MSHLEMLWKMQKYDHELEELKSKKNDLEEGEPLEDILLKLEEREYDITDLKTQLEVDDAKIQRHNQKLKQLNYKIKEVNEKLYSGNITNVKKLTNLQEEEKELKKEAEELENDILEYMEKIEENTKKLYDLETKKENLNEEYKTTKKQNEEFLENIDEEISNIKEEQDKLKNDIDDNILEKYKGLKSKKSKAVVRIEGDKCTGCHMSIPLSVLSKIKKGDNITYCDNCGRILYHENK